MADRLPRKLPAILYADAAGLGRLTSRSSGKSCVSYGTIVGRVSFSEEWQKEMADNNKTVGRHVPELVMDLPTTAIGKDFLTNGSIVESAPSGTGGQLSLYGLLGVTVAREEGLELNILALNFGIDVLHPAIKLPGIGRIGMSKTPQPDPPDH